MEAGQRRSASKQPDAEKQPSARQPHLANARLLALEVRLVVARDKVHFFAACVHGAAVAQVDKDQVLFHHQEGQHRCARVVRALKGERPEG